MRAQRIIVILIVVNILLGLLAAGVILSPEYAAVDVAVRKGATLPRPSPEVARAVTARPDWKRELLPRRSACRMFCYLRSALILRFYSNDELLRAYIATH
jgi:hypothetical protein